jgi:hypothetical protein
MWKKGWEGRIFIFERLFIAGSAKKTHHDLNHHAPIRPCKAAASQRVAKLCQDSPASMNNEEGI